MDYKIGDVSALFGLSTEALRNYERAGLISSKREKSYFRCYDIDTVRKLVGLRTQRNEGLSIQELQRVYHDISIGEYHDLIKEKTRQLEQKVTYERLILEQLRDLEGKIADTREHPGRISEVASPEFYVLPYCLEFLIDMEGLRFQQLAEWTNNLFLVRHMHSFSQAGEKAPQENAISMVIEKSVAEQLGIDCSPPVFFQPSQRCVYCSWLKRAKEESSIENAWKLLNDYSKAQKLEIAGAPFYISTFTFHEKEEVVSCMDVYLPVEEGKR